MRKYLLISIIVIGIILFAKTPPSETMVFSEIVKDMGYNDVGENPYEVVDFTIPTEFNNVYERYNNLLKESGYDLSPYKGKRCRRYTYLIPSQNARANIIVHNGKIIGGDIMGITLDGVMIPIKNNNDD